MKPKTLHIASKTTLKQTKGLTIMDAPDLLAIAASKLAAATVDAQFYEALNIGGAHDYITGATQPTIDTLTAARDAALATKAAWIEAVALIAAH